MLMNTKKPQNYELNQPWNKIISLKNNISIICGRTKDVIINISALSIFFNDS